jgi:glycosyltransferase involved in cell wall biosynthesis
MKIIYHHRTRSTDAQRIHIQEIVRAFEELGHNIEVASLVPLNAEQHNAERDAGDALWKKLVRKIPFAYEIAQLGYNLIGIPMLLSRMLRGKTNFLYERYALFNFAGVITAKLCRIPLILEVNSPFALEQARDREIRAIGLARWTESRICNMATRVVVVSTPLARLMEAAGVAAEKIDVMANGVSLADFQPQPASLELRRKLGIDGSVVIGFVGWFRKWHGLEMLVDAFHRSRLAGKGVKVLLIGDGPAMADLRKFVEAHGLRDAVVFTGPVPHAEVPRNLNLIDIAVQPAANEYCCPMKILEYMALGKPMVAPRQDNIAELVIDQQEALLFEPGSPDSLADVLKRLGGDAQLRTTMGKSARAAIFKRGYLWVNNAQRVIEAVQRRGAARPVSAGQTVASGL